MPLRSDRPWRVLRLGAAKGLTRSGGPGPIAEPLNVTMYYFA